MYDYELIGDENGWWSVNDVFPGPIIEIPSNIVGSDKLLIQFLKNEGYIKKHIHNSKIEIDGETDHALYFNYNYIPQFELRNMEEK
jgi:hypothetical protein